MSLRMFSEFVRERTWKLLASLIAVVLLVFSGGRLMEKRRYHAVFAIVALVVLGLFMAYHLGIEPGTDRMKTVKTFAVRARTIVGAKETVVYVDSFNTEMIYFMDRDYHRKVAPADRWVICSPKSAARLLADCNGAWRERMRTVENHQYPAVLLERESAAVETPNSLDKTGGDQKK